MSADLINKKTDTNRSAADKINKGILDSYDSLQKATKANQDSSLALLKSRSVQNQLNTIIIESGTSDAETLQLRTDAEGVTHATAKERADSDYQRLKEHADESISKITDLVKSDDKNYKISSRKVITGDIEYFVTTVFPKTSEAKSRMVKKGFGGDTDVLESIQKESISNFSKRKKALITINASGFFATGRPTGVQVCNRKIVQGHHSGLRFDETAVFYADGRMDILTGALTNAQLSNVVNSFHFGPWLIKDGVKRAKSTEEFFTNREPRQGIGQKADGTLVIITVDGRSYRSQGVSLNDFSGYFVQEGCRVAYNLDGGGSAQTLIEGERINQFSDGVERAVPDFLYVSYDPVEEIGIFSEINEARSESSSLIKAVEKAKVSPTNYNVMNYHFVNDGTVDNSARMLALLEEVNAAGGGHIHFPRGTYMMGRQYHSANASSSSAVRFPIPAKTRISGEGKGVTEILRNPQHTGDVLLLVNGDQVTIKGMTINGNAANAPDSNGLISSLGGHNHTYITDVDFRNATHRALTFMGTTTNVQITECQFYNIGNEAIYFDDGLEVDISNNRFRDNKNDRTCIYVQGNDFTINGNRIKNFDSAFRILGADTVTISGGNMFKNLRSLVASGTVRHFSFSGNTVRGVGSGVAAFNFTNSATQNTDYVSIVGNSIYDAAVKPLAPTPSGAGRFVVANNATNLT
ncbi:MAG: phosphodiester glycosidase family protein [Bacillaceae bacterium]